MNLEKNVLQAVILADDFTNMQVPYEITSYRLMFPSVLTPLISSTLFDYMIETLVKSRIQEVFIYCSSHVDLLRNYIEKKNCEDIAIHLIVSDGCSSLGDALRDIDTKGLIRGHFILIRATAFTNANLSSLLNAHRLKVRKDKGATMTMILRNVGTTRHSSLIDDMTLIVSDKVNNQILYYDTLKDSSKSVPLKLSCFLERDTEINTCYLDSHVYMCSPSFLPLFADNFDYQTMDDFIRGVLMNEEILNLRIYWQRLNVEDYALPIISWKTYYKLSRDILRRNCFPLTFSSSKNFICMPRCTYRHETATLAKGCLLEKDCFLGYKSVLGSNTKVTSSVIANNCVVGNNVNISNSYIFSNVKIEDNCNITYSILFPDCIIGKNSTVDGCLLTNSIIIEPHSTYHLNVFKNKASNPSHSSVTVDRLDCATFIYLDNIRNPKVKDEDSESLSDESLSESDSPVPDDMNTFFLEVSDSLLRGYQDKLKCEHLILEINSSRYAYNISVREVTYNVIKAILMLPLRYIVDTNAILNNHNYQKNLSDMLRYFNPIIKNYVKNEDAQMDCLDAIEKVASKTEQLLPYVQQLLHKLYDRDILTEEKILEWYESSNEDVDTKEVRNALQPFIKWLQEAEENSSESDSDDS